MSLAGYIAPTRTVTLPDGKDYPVKGLSASDIVTIVATHKDGMVEAFNRITKAGPESGFNPEAGEAEVAKALTDLISDFPLLAAHIIAAGFGDAKDIDITMSFPVGVQIVALNAIGEMTFTSSGGVKNVVEIVVNMLAGSRTVLAQVSAKP